MQMELLFSQKSKPFLIERPLQTLTNLYYMHILLLVSSAG